MDMDNLNWKPVDPMVWEYKEEGDMIEGVLLQKFPRGTDSSARYNISNKAGIWLVWGSAVLDDRLTLVEVGNMVRITYKGVKELTGGRTLKIFKVDTAAPPEPTPTKASTDQEQPEPTQEETPTTETITGVHELDKGTVA